MRQRAGLVGGNLEIWSDVGSGTEIELTLPATVAYDEHASRLSSDFQGRNQGIGGDNNPIRVLAVDDHSVFRQGIASLLEDQPDMILVAEAWNWPEAMEQFRAHRPDVTLMDLQMPEMNGLDAAIAIRNESPNARVVVLTTYSGDVQVLRALKAGAQGYLLKSLLHEALVTIRAVHHGKKTLSPEASREIANI